MKRKEQRSTRKVEKVEKTPSRKRKAVDNTGLLEMKKLMADWTVNRKEREKDKEELVEGKPLADTREEGKVIIVEKVETVEKEPVDVVNHVDVVRRKFDKPDVAMNPDSDFDSWKRRRTSLRVVAGKAGDVGDVDVSHGLRENVQQGVGGDMTPPSISERKKRGSNSNSKIKNYFHVICSKDSGTAAGVHRDSGGQGRGGVLPAIYRATQQRDPRMVGSFLLSGGTTDNAAAAVGKPVSRGNSNSTKSVHK